jgi:hypothetical protein
MKVRNLQEKPRSLTCGCESWLQHWENNSGKKADTCSALNCSNNAEVGGHVQKRNGDDNRWYIIPICKSCNGKHGQEYDVKKDTFFVPIENICKLEKLINGKLYEKGRFTR